MKGSYSVSSVAPMPQRVDANGAAEGTLGSHGSPLILCALSRWDWAIAENGCENACRGAQDHPKLSAQHRGGKSIELSLSTPVRFLCRAEARAVFSFLFFFFSSQSSLNGQIRIPWGIPESSSSV